MSLKLPLQIQTSIITQIDNLRRRHLGDILCDNLFPGDASVQMKTNVFSMGASTKPCSRSNKLLVQQFF